jgi:hypothetical protein
VNGHPKSLSADDIIDAFGGTAAVARLCRVNSQAVSHWRRKGIPDARLQFLQLLRPDVFEQPESRQVA